MVSPDVGEFGKTPLEYIALEIETIADIFKMESMEIIIKL